MDSDGDMESLFGSSVPSPESPPTAVPESTNLPASSFTEQPTTVSPQDVLLNPGTAATASSSTIFSLPTVQNHASPSATSNQPSSAAGSGASATSSRSRTTVPAPEGYKKCTKCKLNYPVATYEHMRALGQIDHYVQCTVCREKRRKSTAATKARKAEAEAREQAHRLEQQQQQLQQQYHQPPQLKVEAPDNAPLAFMGVHDGGGNVMLSIEHGSQDEEMVEEADHKGLAFSAMPVAALNTPGSIMGSERASSILTGSSMNVRNDGFLDMDVEYDMKYHENHNSAPKQSRGASLSIESQAHNVANDLASANYQALEQSLMPAPIMAPILAEVIADTASQHTSTNLQLTTTVAIKRPLSGDLIKARVEFERRRFDEARHKCLWMRFQDEATVTRAWKKREAAVILDLVVVPRPEPQPFLGQTYAQGSHRNIHGAYQSPMP
ncbi:uncharacterized protein CTRU02_203228 [Colletotrichum truncatum]|uniref:Uncharacterized protein n=1 Tax=Colletotrichum truncatum TaxID=5467 RepID=A0ACC3Z8R1_COLTU